MAEIGKPFKSIESYNDSMRKSMKDKLFFLDFISGTKCLFVDFGCADGTLLNVLFEHFMDKTDLNGYIGYDISSEMINLAKTKFDYCTRNVIFTDQWDKVLEELNSFNGKKVLVLSSVIHEVYSYCTEDEIEQFWDRVLNSKFDYICIRDMMYSLDMYRPTKPLLSHRSNCGKLQVEPLKSCLKQFEDLWGSVNNNKNFIHFLLKYRWQINWDREVHENYFPIELNDFLDIFYERYNITYLKRFRIPFLEECWKKDFDITIDDYTHIKVIFENKK